MAGRKQKRTVNPNRPKHHMAPSSCIVYLIPNTDYSSPLTTTMGMADSYPNTFSGRKFSIHTRYYIRTLFNNY